MKQLFILLSLILIAVSCRQAPVGEPYETPKTATSEKGMVASAHPEATRVGLEILKKGGNAVDAAIATQLALAVVYQRAGNLAGSGFMVYRSKDGEVTTLDYREKAPLAATHDMYLDSAGNVIEGLSVNGHLSVGVPGSVAGIMAQYEKYGSLPFEELINPAIELAEKGFYLTTAEAAVLNDKMADIKKYNTTPPVFVKDGLWERGDLIVQKDLGKTLRRIRDNGKAGFYEGETAELIVKEMQAGGGIITLEDLKKYQAIWRTPIKFEYRNYSIYSMPPVSSGGICLAQMLGMIENYPISTYGFQSPKAVHLMVEAERRAYADRAQHLGDSDFFDVPVQALIDEAYLKARMNDFTFDTASSSEVIAAGQPIVLKPESEETTHLSVVDAEGNAVSLTTTLNSNFGSKVVVTGAGFFLNNEMDDFSVKPGVPNQFGLVGAEANAIQPEKRMLSSMTPTIVEKDGSLYLVVGTPGGSTIITSVFQVIVNMIDFGMNVDKAVQSKRFHHQWLPDMVFIEDGKMPKPTIDSLIKKGHEVSTRGPIGRVEAIHVGTNGRLYGAADSRGDDAVMGY